MEAPTPSGPDLTIGVPLGMFDDANMVAGHVGDEAVLLVRVDDKTFALSGTCTHYGAPLADGLLIGHTLRCPWHHARFDVRGGDVVCPPARDGLARWRVEEHDGIVTVREKLGDAAPGLPEAERPTLNRRSPQPERVLIIGAGAAGSSAAETLRREGFEGRIVMIDEDPDASVDRPNLSKDFLAGTGDEAWLPLRPEAYYGEQRIERVLGRTATQLDPRGRAVALDDGTTFHYDKLLLATGASPRRLTGVVGPDGTVEYLRTLADCRRIIAVAERARSAVIIGAGFLGLEVAAALRTRGLDVHVVAPEARPLERIMGPEVGRCLQQLHESHGVVFHLSRSVRQVEAARVVLDDGSALACDLVIAGVGAVPRTALAEAAGIGSADGVPVNAMLRTADPYIYAAGDIAQWPLGVDGTPARVEHWVVAQRQGDTVARNMMGADEPFVAAPFFWTRHYDLSVDYVGHAARWDSVSITGDLDAHSASVRYLLDGSHLATATMMRDRESLMAEEELEERGRVRWSTQPASVPAPPAGHPQENVA